METVTRVQEFHGGERALTTPSYQNVNTLEVLSDFTASIMIDPSMYVANRVLPYRSTRKDTGSYYEYEQFGITNHQVKERYEGDGYEITETKRTKKSYLAKQYVVAMQTTYEAVNAGDDAINLEEDAREGVANQFLMHEEELFNDNFMKTGEWGNDLTVTNWTAANSDPVADFLTASANIQRRAKRQVNFIIMGQLTANALRRNQQFLDACEAGGSLDRPALPQEDYISRAFQVPVYVMGASKNETEEDATAVDADDVFLNDKSVLIGHVSPVMGRKSVTAFGKIGWDLFDTDSRRVTIREIENEKTLTTDYVGHTGYVHLKIFSQAANFINDPLA